MTGRGTGQIYGAMMETFEELRGNEMFPPGTSREEQRRWWLARLELLEREQRHAEAEYAKLITHDRH